MRLLSSLHQVQQLEAQVLTLEAAVASATFNFDMLCLVTGLLAVLGLWGFLTVSYLWKVVDGMSPDYPE